MSISAVVLAKDEEKNIENCIEHLTWCDEVIVIDDNSTDNTSSLAKKLGATVLKSPLNANFSVQHNKGLEKAKGDWILFIDADEEVTEQLAKEIKKKITVPVADAYFIKREDILWGKVLKHGEQGNCILLRLAKKGQGKWEGRVHETWEVKGKTARLDSPLRHFPHQSIGEFLQEINMYSTFRAQELYEKKQGIHWWSIIVYPKAKFFQDYIVKAGFLDGTPGFIVAMMMSLHSFLVRGKLWILYQK